MASLENGIILHERYKILEQIGRGGFGAVYRATDLSLSRICAVKENLNDSDESSRQFHREASLLAGLNHRSLPRVTDHFRIDGQGQYLVMDFIKGKSLQQLLAAKMGPLDEESMGTWIIQVTQALHYLHNRQPPIIHRDIKPANIIINQNGVAVLVDFGISKVADGGGQTTMGARAITPGFSPPEQYGVSSTDNRSDLYSLGATLFACVTGKNPPESIQIMMGQATLPEPESINGTISRPLGDVIRHSMILTMGSRYQTAVEMEGALKQARTERLPSGFTKIGSDDFLKTIVDPPEDSALAVTVEQATINQPSDLNLNLTSDPPSASKAIQSKRSIPKNSLPVWAWAIIAVGALLIVCVATFFIIGVYFPSSSTITTVPALSPVNNNDSAPLNPDQPVEVDGIVINWRVGGNSFGQDGADTGNLRISNFALDRQSGNTYGMTTSQLIVFDRFGNQIDQAVYSAGFSAQDMVIGDDGNLYVLDKIATENFVRVFNPSLEFLREFGVRGDGDGEISAPPTHLVFGADGFLWMLDYRRSESVGHDRIVKIDPESGEIADFLQLDKDFSSSDQLVAGEDGKLYVLIGRDAVVFEIDDQFETVREIAVPEASFVDSLGVAADGTFYAGVSQDQVFIHFDEESNIIKRFGNRSKESGTAYPSGVFYNIEKIETLDGNLFVLDESVAYSYIVSIFQ